MRVHLSLHTKFASIHPGHFLLTWILTCSLNATAQDNPSNGAFRLQAGVSALPIFDALRLYPENNIQGAAVMANFGCFIHPRISFGINPYYAKVSNSYATHQMKPYGERQDMTFFGLNSYIRGYIFTRNYISVYLLASMGIGVMKETYTDLALPALGPFRTQNIPVAALFGGVGVSCKITSWMSAEANLPYAMLYRLDDSQNNNYFNTVLPTIGVQFHWQTKGH